MSKSLAQAGESRLDPIARTEYQSFRFRQQTAPWLASWPSDAVDGM